MKQYKELLIDILRNGTVKPPARENMPGTKSLFGRQLRFNLADGFPLITTKEVNFNHIVTELLWFLKGDTNVHYLNHNGMIYWNEDSFKYYKQMCEGQKNKDGEDIYRYTWAKYQAIWGYLSKTGKFYDDLTSEDFEILGFERRTMPVGYKFGDCGYQYGRVWRKWDNVVQTENKYATGYFHKKTIDQISRVFQGLQKDPMGRRHIVTAVDPTHDEDLALYWCHSMFQFNCRPLTIQERIDLANSKYLNKTYYPIPGEVNKDIALMDEMNIPKYYLDCQMYQRSADVFLGVPFNIASYALLTLVFASWLNMVPGEYIHTFGDVHIYDNLVDQVETQIDRHGRKLPILELPAYSKEHLTEGHFNARIRALHPSMFALDGYRPHPRIKGTLSTGINKG